MTPELMTVVVALLALVIAGYALVRAGQAVTPQSAVAALQTAIPLATELADVALTATQAAEQLYRSGKIEPSARLDYAFEYVQKWFPQIDQDTIITAIESAVLLVNMIVESLPTAEGVQDGR